MKGVNCNVISRLKISLIIASLWIVGVSSLYGCEKRNEEKENYFKENGIVCHAAGVIEGYSVTNSLEAFNNSYENGHRFFEVDISMTSDGFFGLFTWMGRK